ncbi:MAG TPA: exosortase/archaeosortase family protein [Terriglobales bacterium]|jgi:exosortase|nr:exosortase/archaeosortase family protein [Terriglobales bacterium]
MSSLASFRASFPKRRALVYGQAAIIFLLAAWLYAPFALGLARQWWQDPNYTHGFFVPVFALFLLWERRAKLAALQIKPNWLGLVMLLFALRALILGTNKSEFLLYRISILLFIAGVVVFLAGWKHLAVISFPLAFLVLMIPSSTLVEQITFPLQIVASKGASFLLMLAGVPAIREGNIILLPSARLEVAEACSGIRSLFSLLTLTIVYGYLAESKIRIRVLLALLAVPISILANALRIAFTGLLVENWGVERAQGTIHMLSGWLVFAASLTLVFLLHRLLQVAWPGDQEAGHDETGIVEEYA